MLRPDGSGTTQLLPCGIVATELQNTRQPLASLGKQGNRTMRRADSRTNRGESCYELELVNAMAPSAKPGGLMRSPSAAPRTLQAMSAIPGARALQRSASAAVPRTADTRSPSRALVPLVPLTEVPAAAAR